MSTTQWQNLLCNLGVWQGSFTQLSPDGEVLSDTPTLVSLEGLDDDRVIRQTIERFPQGGENAHSPTVLEYSSLNRATLVFDNGAFSTGAMQFSPVSEFGVELGFIAIDRRLRIVPLFDSQSHLSTLTLIREFRQGTPIAELPHLTVDRLLGTWQGEAVTLYPDWRSPDTYPTKLSISREGDRLSQHLIAPQFDFTSTAAISESRLEFDRGTPPVQVLLLPDGASCTTPRTILNRQPFFIEIGWLLDENHRQRMIRRYDDRGGWVSLTLIIERKQIG